MSQLEVEDKALPVTTINGRRRNKGANCDIRPTPIETSWHKSICVEGRLQGFNFSAPLPPPF